LSRLLYRTPIYLYRAGLGWLLGERFLLLNHVGRRSGRPRQAVLEVIDIDRENGTYFVASGFGRKSHWYQNIVVHPYVNIQVGRRRLVVTAVPLPPKTSGQALVDYAQRNPGTAKALIGLLGISSDGSEASYRTIGEELIPVVAFRRQQELAPVSRLPGWLLLVIGLGLVWWLKWRKNI
jgi:deazaflavin-dependent oxidoreductase (nitroreductase family)